MTTRSFIQLLIVLLLWLGAVFAAQVIEPTGGMAGCIFFIGLVPFLWFGFALFDRDGA